MDKTLPNFANHSDVNAVTPKRGSWFAPDVAIAWVFTLSAFAAMARWTWGGWPDPTVDFGTQLYVPWQIASGKVLYRDLAYFKGPLSPYFNALCFKCFGASLRTLVFINLGVLLTTLVLLWTTLRAFADVVATTTCLLLVILVFSFIQYRYLGNYNWVTPYAHEYTHGIALSLGAILALRRAERIKRVRWTLLSGMLCGLVFLTTAEVFVACAASLVIAVVLIARQRRADLRSPVAHIAALAACVFAIPLIAFAILSLAMPVRDALHGTLGSWVWVFDRRIGQLGFYRASMGLDDPAARVARLLIIAAAEFIFFAIAFVIARSIPHLYWKLPARIATIVAAIVVGGFLGSALLKIVPWFELALPLPVFVVVIMAFTWRRDAQASCRFVFGVFALALLAKMIFYSRVHHYGFTLALPAMLVVVEVLVGAIPRFIESRGRAGKTFRAIAIASLSAYVVGILYGHQLFAKDKTVHVASNGDEFRADARGEQVNQAVDWLKARASPGDTLAVLPQGLMVNYLARLPHPHRYLNFMPPEVISAGERSIVEAYEAHPPNWIVIARVNVRGDAFYLLDGEYAYGPEMLAWVKSRYEIVAVVPGVANDLSAEWWVMRPKESQVSEIK